MNIQIDGKNWRFNVDIKLTNEVIGALFKHNFKRKNGIIHMLLDDLIGYLFYIDMSSLIDSNTIVTGLSYYFSPDGKLKSFDLYKLLNLQYSKDNFSVYQNKFGRNVIRIDGNFGDISNDYLSEYTEALISNVYNERASFDEFDFDEIFNTDLGIRRSLRNHIKYITLDFLIDQLYLDRDSLIENLSLHNLRVKDI